MTQENRELFLKIESLYNACLENAKIVEADYWNAKADAYRNVLTLMEEL